MQTEVRPYSVLASGYDEVMDHVDYRGWAKYIQSLFELHGGLPESLIELGCGTGAFSFAFSKHYQGRYLATDGSMDMLAVAEEKAREGPCFIEFEHLRFENLKLNEAFDAALLLYDGLNYLTDFEQIEHLLLSMRTILRPGGIFIFDQATRANSSNNQSFFEDSGTCESFSYVRRNSYDPELYLHETIFELDTGAAQFLERHVQRAYLFKEIQDILNDTPLKIEAAYSDFSFMLADESAERIHWVVRNGTHGAT
ncbi:MAG: class I SAM-dependent methyltransferase [Rhodothermia bacterium]|nr:MAG: class I SAM-dependent methyltransferase [Rhodothermia bacterium]